MRPSEADAVTPVATPKTPTEPPRELVVHAAEELERHDLSALERLDLALSPADLVGIVAHPDPAKVCHALDLVQVARRTPQLRSLRISGCAAAVHAGIAAFGGLRELHLADVALDDAMVAALAKLDRLQSWTLTRVEPATEYFRPLAALPLRELTLSDLRKDSGLAALLELWPRTLQEVVLAGPWAGHSAMLALANATAVERLELRETRVGNFSLNQVKSLPRLDRLTLVGNTFNDNSPLYFRELPVTAFTCDCPRMGDAGLRSLRHSRGLRSLRLSQTHITGTGLEHLADLHDLASVVIEGPDVSGAGLQALATHKKLEHLELAGKLEDPRMTGLGQLTTLRTLRLGYPTLDDRVAPQLAELVHLVSLDLAKTRVSDGVMAAVAKMTDLRELKLHHTRITHRGLVHLAPLHNLEVLELDHTDLLDGGTEIFANLSQLRVLRLDHTFITDRTLGHLRALQRLQMLNLSGTVVTEAGLDALADLPALEVLGLEGTRVAAP